MTGRLESVNKPIKGDVRSAPYLLVGSADPLIQRMLLGVLSDAGYRVRCAARGTDLLGKVEHRHPDLVLLDLGDTDHGALTLCAALRAAAGEDPLPILALADSGGARIVQQVFLAGASDFFVKPVDTTLLLAKIRQALQHRADALSLQGRNARVHFDSPTPILGDWQYDPLCKTLTLSDSLDRALDLSRVEDGQRLSRLLRHVHPDDRRMVRGALRRALHLGRDYVLEHRLTDQHGLPHRVRHQLHPVRHPEFGHWRLNGRLELLAKPDRRPAGPGSTSRVDELAMAEGRHDDPTATVRC